MKRVHTTSLMQRAWKTVSIVLVCAGVLVGFSIKGATQAPVPAADDNYDDVRAPFDHVIQRNISTMIREGRRTFRFDTFGDEAFWGETLRLHEALATVSPRTALQFGVKVDVDALPPEVVDAIRNGQLDLDDPATTAALLKLNAVVGLTGFFNETGALRSLGIQCALCHSTVDDAFTAGIGHRLDGWANRDLNIGAIIALAPNLRPVADLLGVGVDTVRAALGAWGAGKFDAELFLDGKAFRPDGRSGATLIPNALGLAGYNQHTWGGGWGTVTYWNALMANLEMHGKGTFIDPRLDNAAQFPIAARNGFGHVRTDPDEDQITSKLPALHFYQLAIPAPKPRPGVDFDVEAAARGDALFSGKATCNNCHVEPLWTEPGWNVHKPEEIGVDSFQADRAPDKTYKTMNLAGIFIRERGLFMQEAHKGRFYHDGRFATLRDVVEHSDTVFNLGLTDQEKRDLVEHVKSL